MYKTICTLVAGVLILAGSAWSSANVTDVELTFGDGFTRARLAVDGEVEYSHQTVEARDGKPFRVILDLENAVHALPAKSFTELPPCPVTAIRTSQFAAQPQAVVRLVFDMRRPSIYRVDTEKGYLTVFFADNAGKEFPVWTATGNPLPKPVSAPAGTPEEKYFAFVENDAADKAPPKPAKQVNEAIQKDRLSSLSPAKSKTKPEPQNKRQEFTSSAVQDTYGPSVDMSTVPVTRKESPRKVSKSAAKSTSETAPESDEVTKPRKIKSMLATTPVTEKPQADKEQKPALVQKSVTVELDNAKKVRLTPPVERIPGFKPYAAHPTQIVDKPRAEAKSQPKPELTRVENAKQTSKTEQPKTQKPATVASKPQVEKQAPQPVVKPGEMYGPSVDMSTVPRTAKPQPEMAKAETKNEDTRKAAKQMASADPPEAKSTKAAGEDNAQVDKADNKSRRTRTTSTSRFRRNPALSKKMKGTLVAEFPKRLVVKYRVQSSRDPFATLINEQRTHNNPVEQRIANVDGLRLVGVIEADDGANRALFEDQEGYGYILKSGDKVRNGYVLRVESNRVYFQIFEYGWSRTVALKIDEY
ncbi:AMIN domain-containing protein [candidate division GN15 bacterium]|nr:AMIN domain-containing protein [candidate division GN15 bacterium]